MLKVSFNLRVHLDFFRLQSVHVRPLCFLSVNTRGQASENQHHWLQKPLVSKRYNLPYRYQKNRQLIHCFIANPAFIVCVCNTIFTERWRSTLFNCVSNIITNSNLLRPFNTTCGGYHRLFSNFGKHYLTCQCCKIKYTSSCGKMEKSTKKRKHEGDKDKTSQPKKQKITETIKSSQKTTPNEKTSLAKKPTPSKELSPTNKQKKDSDKADDDFRSKIVSRRTSVFKSVMEFKFNKKRVRVLSMAKDSPDDCNGLVYWMSRDQRVQDNWAFLYTQRLALKMEVPLHVCFCLVPKFLEATIRQFSFMLKGLQEVEEECRDLNIPFHLLVGYARDVLPQFVSENKIGGVVTDFSPLRVPMAWVEDVKNQLPKDVPFSQVDAHNLVPCWEASPKLEYGARTIRNKIHNQLSQYLTEFPPVIKHTYRVKDMPERVDWKAAEDRLEVDRSVLLPEWCTPGTNGGLNMLESFLKERLKYFATERNIPNKNALSNLSPWIHFGNISVQRSVLMVKEYRSKYKDSVEGYIEEAVIRRELADNFCYHNKNYDSIEGAYDWAKESLKLHWDDKREYIYTRPQLELYETHDDLWNAAQHQMVTEGKMHGFLRMYWAKKILEWTPNPEIALKEAIYLNDKYQLDGRDPNGYVGCMWSICGIHDRGWKERPVFGKIRYMNYKGCTRKFDVPAFVKANSHGATCSNYL
ncbi:deoxyribodipyrimidine photo-lyase isoform X2 [Patella vulgata]|uniref:deoxyribodipyrimidine photo-lyase isoform X2 n=1 Tax=Patella vulgata TaxID=6465 RepID=UPI0021802F3E|nr:deoxyribodipyrimidine photo-lyase isoform X2 [Patella vulgata]